MSEGALIEEAARPVADENGARFLVSPWGGKLVQLVADAAERVELR